MYCGNCGKEIPDNASVCPYCGSPTGENITDYYNQQNTDNGETEYLNNSDAANNSGVTEWQNTQKNPYDAYGQGNAKPPRNGKDKSIAPLIAIASVLAAVLVVLGYIGGSYFISGNSPWKAEPSPSPSPSAEPTATPVPTPTPEIIYITPTPNMAVVQPPGPVVPPPNENGAPAGGGNAPSGGGNAPSGGGNVPSGYMTYSSSSYGFSCSYPSNYVTYNDNNDESLYTVMSPDGTVHERIAAEHNPSYSVNSSMQSFISTYGGYVDYQTSGDSYYAVRLLSGRYYHYKYCKFTGGNAVWFEITFPDDGNFNRYDSMINTIYSSMSFY